MSLPRLVLPLSSYPVTCLRLSVSLTAFCVMREGRIAGEVTGSPDQSDRPGSHHGIFDRVIRTTRLTANDTSERDKDHDRDNDRSAECQQGKVPVHTYGLGHVACARHSRRSDSIS